MKITAQILAPVILSLILASVGAVAQIKSAAPHRLPAARPPMISLTNSRLPGKTGRWELQTGPMTNPPALAAGTYEAEPYTCLIAVPKPTHDNCCVGGDMTGRWVSKMPVSKPELRLVPRAKP